MAHDRRSTGEQFAQQWRAWRAEWEQWLVTPHGWLSARSSHWLDSTARRYPGLPGVWSQDRDMIVIDPDATMMSFAGSSFDSTQRLTLVDAPDDQRVVAGELEIGITYRDTYLIVVYDPNSPARQDFRGVPTFEPDPDWILTGHYEPRDSPGSLMLDSVDPSVRAHRYDSAGHVRFRYDGQDYTLQVPRSGGMVNMVFADTTNGVSTYGAGRSLVISPVSEDGQVRLDFNRAVNLPCAFGDNFPICPVPPPTNQLPFAIEAGEQMPVG